MTINQSLGDADQRMGKAVEVTRDHRISLVLRQVDGECLWRVDPGFDTHNVLTLKMSLKGAQYDKAEAVEQVVRNGVEKLKAIPGVVARLCRRSGQDGRDTLQAGRR